jgi:predicted dehydrogenase
MQQKETILAAGAATRREFIKQAAAATAAVAATGFIRTPVYGQTTAPSANVAGANSKLAIGFIGLGNQGLNSHLKPIVAAAQENNVAAVAVCEVSKHRLEEALAAAEGAKGYTDYHQMLERKDIDVIFCATVDHWHARVSVDALNAGKHVYVEKPMSRYLPEAFEMYDAVKKTGKILQVGSQGTSDLKWHKAAEWVKAGKIGKLVMCQGSYMRNNPKGEWNYTLQSWASKDDINWQLWTGNQIKAKKDYSSDTYFRWRKYYPYCAGLLGDLFPHKLHPYMLATGNPEFPTRVAALGSRPVDSDKNTEGTPERDSPEILNLIAEFPSGMIMHICSSSVNEQGTQEMMRGSKADLTLGGNRVELKPERPYAEEIEPESSEQFPPESIPVHHKNFFESIRANKQPNCGVELALRVQTVVALGEMSNRLGVMCIFDEKTRKITTSDGKELQPLTYGSVEGLS